MQGTTAMLWHRQRRSRSPVVKRRLSPALKPVLCTPLIGKVGHFHRAPCVIAESEKNAMCAHKRHGFVALAVLHITQRGFTSSNEVPPYGATS